MSPAPGRYDSLADALPPEIVAVLQDIRRATGKHPLRIDLDCEPSLTGLPWEAAISAALSPDPAKQLGGWDVVRGFAPRRVLVGRERTMTAVLAPRPWEPLARRAWPGVRPWLVSTAERDLEHSRAVHIVATTVPSDVGPLLLIGPDEPPLRPARLHVDGAWVLLQGEPLDGSGRSNTEREQVSELRLCAQALIDAGAELVVTVPSLSPELAAQALAQLVPAFTSSSGDPASWLDTVAAARQTIAGSEQNPVRLELALDVTIFIN